MKIALVIYQYSDSKGGVERYVSDLSKGLVGLGHEVHIFCHLNEPRTTNHEQRKIVFHPIPVSFGFSNASRLFSFANNSARLLKQDKFDIIQGFGRTYYQDILRFGSGVHWEYLKRRHPSMNHPLGRLIQWLNPRNRIIMSLERKSLSPGNYKKVICISHLVKEEIRRYYNVPAESIVVIHNAIDLERFHPDNQTKYRQPVRDELGIKPDEIVVLFVGSGFERKGLRYAIESLALIKEIPLKLLVIGKGNVVKYQALARKNGVEEQILFLGTKNNIEQYYAAADIFLFPSLYDAFGTAVLEAMASGLPCLVSCQTGAAEVVQDTIDGFLIKPDEVMNIAQRLKNLTDPVWRENMGQAARVTALKHSFNDNLKTVLKVYEEVARPTNNE